MRRRGSGGPSDSGSAVELDEIVKDGALQGFEEELRDFLAADEVGVRADPRFKERLRRELWRIVEKNSDRWRTEDAGEDDGPD